MCLCGKKIPENKGSLLLEAVVACGVLAAGLLALMQSFAVQRQAVSTNILRTEEFFLLQSKCAAVYAGVRGEQAVSLQGAVKSTRKENALGIGGLRYVELGFLPAQAKTEGRPLEFYVRRNADRSGE